MREKILNDLKEAMKSQNKQLLAVIRMVKGAMQLEEINLKRELNDDEVIAVIAKQIKIRKESLVEFEKGNREDLIYQTNEEIKILNTYMPVQMSEEEINKAIDEVFTKVNPTNPSDMGKVMGAIAPLVKGKADLGLVNKLIRDRLSNL
jgi:uncharacterized protein YqeY